MKIVVITGGSSGIGFATLKELLAHDCKVYELSRRSFAYENVIHKSVDVTDTASVEAAIQEIYEAEKRIDILINCAGYGVAGAVEFTSIEDAKRQLDVNFYGVVNVTKAVLPIMRKARAGRVVNVSSIAGVAPLPFQTYYSCAKAAVNSYTFSVANEVKPFGITVAAVMPGDIKTPFTQARVKTIEGDAEYNGRIGRSIAGMEKDEANGMDPSVAGKYIAGIALKKRVKPIYSIGLGYKMIHMLCRFLPSQMKNWIIYLLYAR